MNMKICSYFIKSLKNMHSVAKYLKVIWKCNETMKIATLSVYDGVITNKKGKKLSNDWQQKQ